MRRAGRRVTMILLVLVGVLAAAVALLRNAGRWLVREDPLAKADAIVVLSGGLPYRAEEAARIFRMGHAPEVWVSYPANPAAELQALGIQYVGEEEYDREILVHSGVPVRAIWIFPDPIINTEQEVRAVLRELQRRGKSRVIFVTSPEHTRRVKTLFRKIAAGKAESVVCAAANDPFDSAHWWENTRDALAVVREYLGLMNAWAGLPVRPH